MGQLPVETWMQISNNHLNRLEWLALSTTSSFFRPIAQVSLYRHISLERDTENLAFAQFVRSLGERPELGSFVHSLNLETYADKADYDRYKGHPILSKIGLFPQLRRLKLIGLCIEADFCLALLSRQFPRLSYVEFDRCWLARHLPAKHNYANSGTVLSTIAIKYPCNFDPQDDDWSFVTSTRVQELVISGWPNDIGRTDAMMLNFSQTHTLTKLIIDSIRCIPANLIPFLVSSPQIRSLTIGFWDWKPQDADSTHLRLLPLDALPFLEEFKGSAEFSRAIVPGRPIHTVHLQLHPSFPIDVLLPLRLSTASITEMMFVNHGVSSLKIDYGSFLQYAPTSILRFKWDFSSKRTVLSYLPALSRLTSLQVIKGSLRTTLKVIDKYAEKREVVQKFSEACPSIREFNFVEERWLARKPDGWERYLVR